MSDDQQLAASTKLQAVQRGRSVRANTEIAAEQTVVDEVKEDSPSSSTTAAGAKVAKINPEYTWSQTSDEVTLEMPVRSQTEHRLGFVCTVCLTQRWWGSRAMT